LRARSSGVVAVLALLLGCPAFAHEVLHTVERGRAVAVKAFFADGEPLAYTEYVIFSPADAKIPYQKGRTDRSGYLAFVPNVPGAWHVKITGADGHGLEADVTVDSAGLDAARGAPAAGIATWAFVARPLVGVVLIAGLFVLLAFAYRKRGAKK
jgi:nickel transport protein